jgi:hypothetical protein
MTYIPRQTLIAIAMVAFVSTFTSRPVSAQGDTIDVLCWGLGLPQSAQVCVNGPDRAASSDYQSLWFVHVSGFSEGVFTEVKTIDLEVPVGEFRCINIPYSELERVDSDPRTGVRTLQIRLSRALDKKDEATWPATVATITNVDNSTGTTEAPVSVYEWGEIKLRDRKTGG